MDKATYKRRRCAIVGWYYLQSRVNQLLTMPTIAGTRQVVSYHQRTESYALIVEEQKYIYVQKENAYCLKWKL